MADNTNKKLTPNILLTPLDWAAEAQRRASEYSGMPEGSWFLVEARRYLAMHEEIQKLKDRINYLEDEAYNAKIERDLNT